jgi:hypothetical protein
MAWSVLSQTGFLPAVVWRNLSDALAIAMPWTKWLWISLTALAVSRLRGNREPANANPDAAVVLYAVTALIAGIVTFFIYLRLAALPTRVWYYLPLMTLAAVCIDAALANCAPRFQPGRWLLAGLTVAIPFASAWTAIQYRQTDIDLIATTLLDEAGPDDLILVHPWYCGITFERYFRGATPWTTIPDIADHRFHRYDLFKLKMQTQDPLAPVLARVAATLESGHRVWVVGWVPVSKSPPRDLGPAPNKQYGWLEEPYTQEWGEQIGYFIATHAARAETISAETIPIQLPSGINPLEDLPLVMVTGWRVPPQPQTER